MSLTDRTRTFADIPFSITTLEGAADDICLLSQSPSPGTDIHLLNAFSIALADSDSRLMECYQSAGCNLPDGKPISVLTIRSRETLRQVRGPELFERVMDIGRKTGVKHFLLGSTPATLALLQKELELRYPGVNIVGSVSPPFRELSDEERSVQDEVIRNSGAHIVWVGLGTPKQDFEARRLAGEGFLAVAVGAAFDFSAGTKKKAPHWLSNVGLEWLFRFASEPKRLWRRYTFGNVMFLKAYLTRR